MDRSDRTLVGAAALVVAAGVLLASPGMALARLAWLAADPVRFGLACVALALVRPLLAWPATVLGVAAGFGFGVAGAPFAVVLFVLTAVPPYLFARRVGGGGRVAAAGRRLTAAAGDLRSVTATRLLPAPSDAISLGAGAAGVPARPFLLGTALGEAPWAVAGTLAGASLSSLAAGRLAVDLGLVAAAGAVALLLLAGPAYRTYAA
jgi:uncharacterized membrane protein YdjX (TVP38/TMEM64 family)